MLKNSREKFAQAAKDTQGKALNWASVQRQKQTFNVVQEN